MIKNSILVRAIPFAAYILFLIFVVAISQYTSDAQVDPRWIYPVKTICVAGLLIWFWRKYSELTDFNLPLKELLISIGLGLVVFVLWINMDISWMTTGPSAGFDPRTTSNQIDWYLALPRILGAAFVVPIMEELFWRSFIMRWIQNHDFLGLAPEQVGLKALLLSSILFGIEHSLWLAGIVAGLAYGWLYIKTRNLWAPIIAHGITNGLLGLWVLKTGQWQFW